MHCGYAKHHVWIRGTGRCMPCPAYNELVDPIGIYNDVGGFFSSNEMEILRADLAADIRRPGCERCWAVEDAGVPGSVSARQWGNDLYFTDIDQPVGITALEISAGRTCTLKCRMCGSHSSTAWAAELSSRGVQVTASNLDWTTVSTDHLKTLTYLKITGGEPFLSPKLAVMLKELQQSGLSKQIDVEIFTNAEEFPSAKFTDYMRDFNSCRIYFSIDGVGKRNEYIRSGSSWPVTIATILNWGKWKAELGLDRVRYSISHTYTTYNCLYGLEMADWVKSMRSNPGLENLDLEGWHFAWDDSWHNVTKLPGGIKKELAYMLDELRPFIGLEETIDPDYWFPFYYSKEVLQADLHGLPSEPFNDWWQEMLVLDKLRGQNINDSLPELVELFRRHELFTHRN